ncbi:MAG: hypothetical protein ACJAY5_000615 [Actinomycetes bacterium]
MRPPSTSSPESTLPRAVTTTSRFQLAVPAVSVATTATVEPFVADPVTVTVPRAARNMDPSLLICTTVSVVSR